MPTEKRPLRVFLCHASQDKPKVRELYRYLRRRGIQPWFDEENLIGGQDWQIEIPKAIQSSDAIIICLTKNAVDKEGYVQKEIKFALDKALEMPEGRIYLIPVRFEECAVPFSLTRYQWVDLFEQSGFPRLMRSLKQRASELERATVDVPKLDEPKPNLFSTSSGNINNFSVEVGGNVQGNIIIGDNNNAQSTSEMEKKKGQDEEVKRWESEAIQMELRGDFRNAQRAYYKIKEVNPLFPRVDVKIRELEQELRPKPSPPTVSHGRVLSFPLLTGIIIAAVGLLITLYIIGSQFAAANFNNTPRKITSLETDTVMPSSRTPRPTLTQTAIFTVTPPFHIGSTSTSLVDGMTMIYVPAGPFYMGSNDFSDSQPIRNVSLDAFWIDQTDVTNKMYSVCIHAGSCSPPSKTSSSTRPIYFGNYVFDNFPVINVSWDNATTYCNWAARRLPTEAEWEKAARGTDGRIYPWGDNNDYTRGNFNNNILDTTAVGSYKSGASPYGAYDMAGNVWQWVNDWYGKDYYALSGASVRNPQGPTNGTGRVLRGGSYSSAEVSSARRLADFPSYTNYNYGFRCARSAP